MSTNYLFAVRHLKTCVKSVRDWNELREGLKRTLTMKEVIYLDGSGLIVEILGPDKYFAYNQN